MAKVITVCASCNKEFLKRSDFLRERNFCSRNCVRDYRYGTNRHVVITCICGKEIKRTKNRGTKFCSKKCAAEALMVDGAAWRDPEYIKLYQRKYQREWYKKNRAKILEGNKARHKSDPGRRQTLCITYRTKKASLPNDFTDKDWSDCLAYWNNRCAVCEKPQGLFHILSADHWIPMASADCPGTVPHNIIPLCHGEGGCNNSKSKRDGATWLEQRLGKRKAAKRLKMITDYLNSVKR